MRSAVTFSISGTKDCDWLKTIFTSLTPPCFLPSPSHQTLDGMQGPDHHCSLAPRGYSVCVYVGVYVCVLARMRCKHESVLRAETPDMLWKCPVDRGQTGHDLLEEAQPAL